ncbi:hypothetical protein [Leptospira interrogans]|uniref:hypothetical protein n=1 Tax=Leptospira interrogans TaxID=173 RepID=UPI00398FF4B1
MAVVPTFKGSICRVQIPTFFRMMCSLRRAYVEKVKTEFNCADKRFKDKIENAKYNKRDTKKLYYKKII